MSSIPHVELPQAEFKIVLLGDTNTGKTSLALRFVEGYYKGDGISSTVGAFFLTKRITTVHQKTSCKLLLWDTAGQAHFRRLAKTYYQQAAAAVFSYDVSQPQSLHRLRLLLREVQENTVDRRIVIAIVACKNDLDPSLHHPGLRAEAEELAREIQALHVVTSAKTNEGVHDLFEQISERVLQSHREAQAGMGLPIPVTVGAMSAKKQLRSRSMGRFSTSPAVIMPRVASSSHAAFSSSAGRLTSKEDLYTQKTPELQTSDTSHDDNDECGDAADDFVDEVSVRSSGTEGQKKNRFLCDGALMSCTPAYPDKGCILM